MCRLQKLFSCMEMVPFAKQHRGNTGDGSLCCLISLATQMDMESLFRMPFVVYPRFIDMREGNSEDP